MNQKRNNRPSIWYNVLCVSALTYNLFYIALLILGLLNIPFLQKTFTNYTESTTQNLHLQLYIITTLILNLTAVFGVIKLLSYRLTGYYFYLSATVSLVILKLFFVSINWVEIGLLFLYLILFTTLIKKYR